MDPSTQSIYPSDRRPYKPPCHDAKLCRSLGKVLGSNRCEVRDRHSLLQTSGRCGHRVASSNDTDCVSCSGAARRVDDALAPLLWLLQRLAANAVLEAPCRLAQGTLELLTAKSFFYGVFKLTQPRAVRMLVLRSGLLASRGARAPCSFASRGLRSH